MNKPGIVVHIGTEYTDRDLKRAQADLRRLETGAKGTTGSMSKFGSTMQNAVGRNLYSVQTALAGAVAGMGAFAISMAVDGVKAAMDEEQQLARLRTALDNVNQGFALDGITQFIDKMMYATGVADDELRPAFQTLVTATRDAAKAQDLLTLAVDISVARQKDLGSVAVALAKASNGQATALTRLGVGLSDNARKAGNFSLAVEELSAAFGGQAAANADTFAGRLKILQIAFDETKEAFGTGFLEGFSSSLESFGTMTDGFVSMQDSVEDLGVEVGKIAGEVVALTSAFFKLKEELGPFGFILDPFTGLKNDMTFAATAVEAVKDGLQKMLPFLDISGDEMQDLGDTDFSHLRSQLREARDAVNELAVDRAFTISAQLNVNVFQAGQVGMSPALNAILTGFFADAQEETDNAAAAAAPKVDPFKEWQKALTESGRKLAVRARLIAKGIPAAMADGILSDPGWAKIAQGVMRAGRDAVDKYVEQWKRAPEGVEAIGSQVDAIVEAAQKRLDALQDEREKFAEIRRGFFEETMEFGKLTTLQGEGPISAELITENLRQRLAIVRQFATALEKLRAAGLGRAALGDVISLGPFEGLQYANAILQGGAATIQEIQTISGQFVRPSERIATIGAEVMTGKTEAILDQSTNFSIEAGGINITINGEITAQTRRDIEQAVTDAFGRVGRESRARGRTGVR